MESYTKRRKKVTHNMRTQKRINFMRRIDEHKTIKKESTMFNSINQKPPWMSKGKAKQIVTDSTREWGWIPTKLQES
jgi:hypothetical protein